MNSKAFESVESTAQEKCIDSLSKKSIFTRGNMLFDYFMAMFNYIFLASFRMQQHDKFDTCRQNDMSALDSVNCKTLRIP